MITIDLIGTLKDYRDHGYGGQIIRQIQSIVRNWEQQGTNSIIALLSGTDAEEIYFKLGFGQSKIPEIQDEMRKLVNPRNEDIKTLIWTSDPKKYKIELQFQGE